MVKLPEEIKVKIKIDDLIGGSVNELEEYKAKQKGDITPRSLTAILLNELVTGDIEQLIVIRKLKNGLIATGWTTENAVEALGMAEMLKAHIFDEID